MTTSEAIKNEHKVAINLVFFQKISSINDEISYTLVLLIMHDDEYLDCGCYVSDFFNATQTFGGTVMMTISLKLVIYQKGFILDRLMAYLHPRL